jgi:hypothetical protein
MMRLKRSTDLPATSCVRDGMNHSLKSHTYDDAHPQGITVTGAMRVRTVFPLNARRITCQRGRPCSELKNNSIYPSESCPCTIPMASY